jgi:hypothetical protein
VAVGDFNGDGKLDLAVANQCGNDPNCVSPGTVTILLGDGTGNFTTASSPATGNQPYSVAVGDFNGDGKLDLAVANQCGSDPSCASPGTVSILLGDGTGNFTTASSLATGNAPQSVAVGDFNGDGRLDLAVANSLDDTVSALLLSAPEAGVPSSLAFGSQNLSSPKTLALTITNTGTAALNITGTSLSGPNSADFTAALNTCSSPFSPGGNCSLNVTFTPSIAGVESATLTVTDNAGSGTQTVSLTGTGVGIPVAGVSPPSLSFGNQQQGTTSSPETVMLSNTGTGALAISSISISGNFVQTNNCGSSLAQNSSCQISVTFTPQSAGALTGTLTINDNSNGVTGSTQVVRLSGTGLAAFSITPTPKTETVHRGLLAGFLLTLKSLDGFKGSVTLSCSGGPAGSYCADLPQKVYLTGTAYAISGILFPKDTTPGTYTIKFTGTSGAIIEDATATFIVE